MAVAALRPSPALTSAVGSAGAAREVQRLLNTVSAQTSSAAAARLATLVVAGEAEAGALAQALVRCASAFQPAVFASVAVGLQEALGETWTEALAAALAPATVSRGIDAFAERLCTSRCAAAVLRALQLQPASATRLSLLLLRLAPLLVVEEPGCAPALSALVPVGSCACSAAEPLGPPMQHCAPCLARELATGGWLLAGRAFPAAADDAEEGAEDGGLTQAVLCGSADQLPRLRLLAAALPWRQEQRGAVMRGLQLSFRQTPRFGAAEGARRADAGSTGLVAWGAAELMAGHLEHGAGAHLERLRAGGTVLELGCGIGLCAAAAALQGGAVTATDGCDEVVALAAANCGEALRAAAAAGLAGVGPPVRVARLRWGDAAELSACVPPASLSPPLLLLSDGLYFDEAHEALLETLAALAQAWPGCCLLLGHTWRKRDLEAAFLRRLCQLDAFAEYADVTPLAEGPVRVPPGTRLLLFQRRD